MSAALAAFVSRLEAGETLDDGELDAMFAIVMDGQADPAQLKPFLLATVALMVDPRALAAGARALRARMVSVAAPEDAIDVCGTGGDGAHTLNISTAVAFVVAGCGAPVAKHGNRAMSSKTGAADVLEALGVKLTGDVPMLERCLHEANVAFLFAQNHHPAMRHVGAARRELGQRTIFNLLGPLSNPAGVTRQLLGVFGADFVPPVAEALRLLGAVRAWTICGHGGLDELSCEGENIVAELADSTVRLRRIGAADAHLGASPNSAVRGGDPAHNAAALRALLDGRSRGSPYADIVQLNAGAALVAAGRAQGLAEGAVMAHDSLAEGRAARALDALIALTRDAP